ncbi:3-phenylpropionate-dihydrodiol/cinnamic acid-dihydrodiol dehydrogenase [Halalkalicoccus paucihalophilus]|uniref:3-phenylpropionate-dihydrodiol/cinnamic acid-dihydrodiol dehydrogenase n=1 Tax=Halalkalicoccus paucihalophilus TaxID=1008153 RepID=A0A151A9Q1_9EURY|nr:SDR family oxidoreductase [Halalkalicoccus paucihalophilus]KYH24436.1 3-phenylpropionate-dihydrodiol/cinnamic acid-dihydrodiol dehydrogenase [Halalkalicoccus paucihalophilus]
MDLDLEGKRAYLTAASSGLGEAVATELVREGANVIISSHDEDNLRMAVDSITEATGRTETIDYTVCDLSDPESIQDATWKAIDNLGGLDVLVTNHGGPRIDPFSELSLEDFDTAYQGILRSTLQVCQESLPALSNGRGSITNLVAASALEPSASGAVGNVFRPGIYGLSKVLSEEYGESDIRVNCVSPRGIMSDRIEQKLSQRAERQGISEQEARGQRVAELPVSDLGTPESFARTVAFLASPAADYVTGAVLPVDGGWHRHAF